MDLTRKLSFLVFVLFVLISLKNQNADNIDWFQNKDYSGSDSPWFLGEERKLGDILTDEAASREWLRYDYYSESCPFAERIIRSTVQELYMLRQDVAPALLRLVFHDCFVEGCDASVLLDAADGVESEKDSFPNESLKGYDLIDIIKSELEESCPGVVSCADIVVLAARESVLLAGGPFYPLLTGRKDSTVSFAEEATYELPSPHAELSKTIESFSSKGFDERETVSLLGAHSTGTIHCQFFFNRLHNFRGSDRPDPSLDPEFLELLRSKCNGTDASTPSPSMSPAPSSAIRTSPDNAELFQDPAMKMDYEGPRKGFGTLYYRSLLQGKGLLFADQQLTAGEETGTWVRAYASDALLFQRDFGLTMMKLSNLHVLTSPLGQVRLNCRKRN